MILSPQFFPALLNNSTNTSEDVSDLSLDLYAHILGHPVNDEEKTPAAQLLVRIVASFYDFHKANSALVRGLVDHIPVDEWTTLSRRRDRRVAVLGQSPFDVHLQHYIHLILDQVDKLEYYETSRNHDMAFHSYAKLGEFAYTCCFFVPSPDIDTDRARRNWFLCEGRAFLLNMYHNSEEGDCNIGSQTIVSRLWNDGSWLRVRNSIFYYGIFMTIDGKSEGNSTNVNNNSDNNNSDNNNSDNNNSDNDGEGSNIYFSGDCGDNDIICAHFPRNYTPYRDCKCNDESMLRG